MEYYKIFSSEAEYNAYMEGDNVVLPNISLISGYDVRITPNDFPLNYLTFKIESDGVIGWKASNSSTAKTISYSKDDGITWTDITSDTGDTAPSISVTRGETVLFKGNNNNYSGYGYWNSFDGTTCQFSVEGNIMSLIYGDNFIGQTTLTQYTFSRLFYGCTGLTSARNLVLPAITLMSQCYVNMFAGCISLTTAPTVLPATTLAQDCYSGMFQGCTSITTAPELPATTLASQCYYYMFSGCISLTTAPELPATTLAQNCYSGMFSGCNKLNYIKAMFTTTPGLNYTANWLYDVSSSGTFVKNSAATWDVTGSYGIPSGWTVQTA